MARWTSPLLWKAIKRKPFGPPVWRQTHTQPSVSQFQASNQWKTRTEKSSAKQNTSREPERSSPRQCRSLAGSDGLFDFRMDQPPSLTANGSTWSLRLALQTLITWEAHPHPHVAGQKETPGTPKIDIETEKGAPQTKIPLNMIAFGDSFL